MPLFLGDANSGSGLMESLDHLFQASSSGVILRVYVQPKARRAQIIGLHADRLKLAVTEPPDKGKANAAVIDLIAETFKVAPSRVSLVRGDTSRQKDIAIQGLAQNDAIAILRSCLPPQ
ncbi:MAG: DUF167 domain-containing protein [Planctomycetaceae bacterium]